MPTNNYRGNGMKFKEKSVLILIILIGVVFLFSSSVSAADTKVLVTKTSTGGYANSQSTNPSTSANGDYVAFESYATNLGTGNSGKGVQDIYVYSYKTKKTEWITHTPTGKAANGNSYTPSISGDGRYVTFASTATNLGPGGSGKGIKDIYLYDRKLKVMKWITHSPTGKAASNHSTAPVISADGSTIAFQSTAKNLGTGGSEYYVSDIYLYNRTTGSLKWVTQTTEGKTANGASMNPSISENGRYIAFETVATNLGPNPYIRYGTGGVKDIFIYDNLLGNLSWKTSTGSVKIQADVSGGPFTTPFYVNLSMDESGSIYWGYDLANITNLYNDSVLATHPYIDQDRHLYFYGLTAYGTTNIVSENYIDSNLIVTPIVWASPSTGFYYNNVDVNLHMSVPGTIYYSIDGSSPGTVYTSTISITNTTTLRFYGVSNDNLTSNFGNEKYTIIKIPIGGTNPSINADGSLFAFESGNEIYIYNVNTGEVVLITRTATGGPSNGKSNNPSLSGDGKTLTFETTAYNLGIDPTQPYGSNIPGIVYYKGDYRKDIFVYHHVGYIFDDDDHDGVVEPEDTDGIANGVDNANMDWITRNTKNGPANGNSYTPSLNGDGSRLAFSSSANNLGSGGNGVYRDIFLSGKGLHDTLPVNVITISQLNTAAKNIRNYYDSHSKTLPTSVTINAQTYTMSQMLYLLTTATINMSNSNLYPIAAKTVNSATSPSGTISSGNIVKSRYISYAKSIRNYINSYGRAPNYVATTLGNMKLKYMVYMYSKIVNYYKSNNRLPNYVSITK